MKAELQLEPEIILVTAQSATDQVVAGPCTPSGCPPNVACNPNTDCAPFNCAPALKPCMPDCAPSTPCYPTQGACSPSQGCYPR